MARDRVHDLVESQPCSSCAMASADITADCLWSAGTWRPRGRSRLASCESVMTSVPSSLRGSYASAIYLRILDLTLYRRACPALFTHTQSPAPNLRLSRPQVQRSSRAARRLSRSCWRRSADTAANADSPWGLASLRLQSISHPPSHATASCPYLMPSVKSLSGGSAPPCSTSSTRAGAHLVGCR